MQRVRKAGYLKGLSVRDVENLWYSWNVNRFCTDQRSSVIVSVMNEENENWLKFIYIYIIARRNVGELF